MHTHGTAVLDGPAETTPAGTTTASARDQWLTKCTEPCQHCDIGPIKHGPHNLYFRDDLIRVPWVPDCTTCNDTGWAFSHHIPAEDARAW